MKLGTEDKKRLIQASIAVPLALIGLIYLYVEVFGGSPPPPSPPPATTVSSTVNNRAATGQKGASAKRLTTSSVGLDPTLHPEVMAAAESLVYTGNGRNIFSASAAPVMIEKPIASARPNAKSTAPAVYTPPPPPPPPPIDLKFFGTVTSGGQRKAFLLHGDDIFIAGAGEIVDRRYRIVNIMLNSVVVEDMPNNNKQSLPLAVQ
ncbi:MAG: hypothetical protein ACYCSN_11920 [Acidobacteriaceae bacterium]